MAREDVTRNDLHEELGTWQAGAGTHFSKQGRVKQNGILEQKPTYYYKREGDPYHKPLQGRGLQKNAAEKEKKGKGGAQSSLRGQRTAAGNMGPFVNAMTRGVLAVATRAANSTEWKVSMRTFLLLRDPVRVSKSA